MNKIGLEKEIMKKLSRYLEPSPDIKKTLDKSKLK